MTFDPATKHPYDRTTLEELNLYHLMMDTRAEAGLDPIAMSKGLSTTAGRHTADWIENIWGEGVQLPTGANLHSWSDAYYYNDHRNSTVMWEAPARIGTSYDATGFEISVAGTRDSASALAAWMGSEGHRDVILNDGPWAPYEWEAIGIGIATPRDSDAASAMPIYHVWFGREPDAAGAPKVFGTGADETFAGTAFDDLFIGKGGNDKMRGEAGDDRLTGGGAKDKLWGGVGDDVVVGGGGGDKLSGDAGDDTIKGGGGNDVIDGGAGEDLLIGGAGRDRFVFRNSWDTDTIADADARDLFRVIGEVASKQAFIDASSQTGADVVYGQDRDGQNVIVFENTTMQDLETFNFSFG